MSLLLSALLLIQAGVRDDISQLRRYLGATYPAVIELLSAKNQILLNNTQRLAPVQEARMRAQMLAPDALPDPPILSARIQNVGQGLLTFLFEDDFIVEQVNFVFCPADPTAPAALPRVLALQVLFDDSRAATSTLKLFQVVYQMPAPINPSPDFKPQLTYPLVPALPVTFWDLGNVEAVYQAVPGNRLIYGQFWLTDKDVVMKCGSIPKLPNP